MIGGLLSGPMLALQNPLYRQLWLGNMAANLGTVFQGVGAAWLMMTMTGSPQMVALVQANVGLPLLVFSLLAGVLADVFDRKRILLISQFYMFIMTAGLTVLTLTGWLTPTLLLVFTFLIGSGFAMQIPSWQASVRELVDRKSLPSAIALHSMGFNLMRSAGPALGGAILALANAAVLFALCGLGYLAFAFSMLFWRRPETLVSARESLPAALLSGLRYSAMSPHLLKVFARGAIFTALSVSLVALLPVVAAETYGGDSFLFGVLLGSFGLGAVLAAIMSPAARTHFSTENIVRATYVICGVSIGLVAVVPNVYVAVLATFFTGSCWVMTNSTLNITIQMSTPAWVAGRSLSIFHTCLFGGMTAGSLGWGILAESAGVQTALVCAAGALIATSMLGLVLPLPGISDDPLEPANTFKEPMVKVDLEKHDRPITIVIHYNISAKDTPEFLEVMKQRRRIRRRDGALRWMLRRDVEHPEHWSESYTVRDWADYVRHNERRIASDASVQERLWALHQSENPPTILRMLEWDAAHGDQKDAADQPEEF